MFQLMEEVGKDKFREQFSDSAAALGWLEAILFDADEATISLLLEEVDESPYSLRVWIAAMIVIGEWLEARSLEATLEDQIGYVGCANAAAGSGANLTDLSELVSDMLDQHGFERASKK